MVKEGCSKSKKKPQWSKKAHICSVNFEELIGDYHGSNKRDELGGL